jgi:hypothetical protein
LSRCFTGACWLWQNWPGSWWMEGQANSQGYCETKGAFSFLWNFVSMLGLSWIRTALLLHDQLIHCVLVNQVESMKQIARKKANEERKRLESEVIRNKFHTYCVLWTICSLACSGLSYYFFSMDKFSCNL